MKLNWLNMADEPNRLRFRLTALITFFLAANVWGAVFLYTTGPYVSPVTTAVVLIVMTSVIYYLLIGRSDALARSALLAGVIAVLSLWIAKALS